MRIKNNRYLNKLQRISIDAIFHLHFNGFFFKSTSPTILCYHGIDLTSDKKLNYRHTSITDFEFQLRFFKKNFNVVSIEDLFNGNFSNDRKTIAITFDDGYLNNYKYAVPLLTKYELPVSFYITGINNTQHNFLWADFVDIVSLYSSKTRFDIGNFEFTKCNGRFYSQFGESIHHFIKHNGDYSIKELLYKEFDDFKEICASNDLDDYWKLVSDEQIIEMSRNQLITIGSHGFYHNNLGNIDIEDSIDEVVKSKAYLENLTQKKVREIAFPDGNYSRELIERLNTIGVDRQLALGYSFHGDEKIDFIKSRHDIYPVYSNFYQIKDIIEHKLTNSIYF